MYLILVGASLTVGSTLLAAVMFTDGALLAPRTAAQVIGWLFILATLAGLAGLRRASPDRIGAVSVTLCSGVVLLYMSYFSQWHATVEKQAQPHEPKTIPMPAAEISTPEPRAPLRPKSIVATPAPKACYGLSGLESLQCDRCSEKTALAWVSCQERVRLEFCESEVAEERSCPSAVPASYPG